MTRPQTTRLTLTLPDAVDRRLRAMAERDGRSISNLAARILRDALEQWERDGSPQ